MNGIANLYVHNWVVKHKWDNVPPSAVDGGGMAPLVSQPKRKSTSMRQFIFDLILTLENISILIFAYNAKHLKALPDQLLFIVLLGHFFGIFLKWGYYATLHLWSNAFEVIKADLSGTCPRISIDARYYWFGKSRWLNLGADIEQKDVNYIKRPSIAQMFGRIDSVRERKTSRGNRELFQDDENLDIFMNTKNTLMEAIDNTNPQDGMANGTDPSQVSGTTISELRNLFEKFLAEAEFAETKVNLRKPSEAKVATRVRFSEHPKKEATPSPMKSGLKKQSTIT